MHKLFNMYGKQFKTEGFKKLILEIEENKTPSLYFESVEKINIKPLKEVIFLDYNNQFFMGRLINCEPTLFGYSYTCEGLVGVLNDTYFKANKDVVYNVNDLMKKVIDNHNEKSTFKMEFLYEKFKTDKTIVLQEGYLKTFDVLIKCVEAIGVFFYLDYNMIKFSDKPLRENNQKIELGSNLLDMKIKYNYFDIKTIVAATGNNNIEVIAENQKAIKKYGKVYDVVNFDVDTKEELTKLANEHLKNVSSDFKTLELNAVDLSLIDKSLDDFKVYDNVHIVCKPLNVNIKMMVKRVELNLLNPIDDKIVFGRKTLKLSEEKQVINEVAQTNREFIASGGKLYRLVVSTGEDGQPKFKFEEVKS